MPAPLPPHWAERIFSWVRDDGLVVEPAREKLLASIGAQAGENWKLAPEHLKTLWTFLSIPGEYDPDKHKPDANIWLHGYLPAGTPFEVLTEVDKLVPRRLSPQEARDARLEALEARVTALELKLWEQGIKEL